MFCQKCGTENKDDASFCSKCGNNLSIKHERKGITGKLGKMGILGFRSGKTWKMGLAFIGYFFIIIAILGASSPSPTQNSASTGGNVQQTIPENISDIRAKLVNCGTIIQCDEWVNSYLNKNKVRWTGTLKDANSEKAIVTIMDTYGSDPWKSKVILYDISPSELIKLNKGQNITFEGQLKIDTDLFREGDYRKLTWDEAWQTATHGTGIELYDVKIQNN